MGAFLGVIGLLFYIACVVVLAASITWVVVRFSPKPKPPTNESPPAA